VNLLEAFLSLLADRLPPCIFHQVTGYPCPTCGTTRAILALAGGRWREAVLFNPLAILAGALFFAWLIGGWAVYGMTGRFPSPRIPPRSLWPIRIGVVLLIAANWAWLIHIGV
jgi:hypothetical protein